MFYLGVLHSSLSTHSEAAQQPRTISHANPKPRPVGESRMLSFDLFFFYLSFQQIESPLFGFTTWTYQRRPSPPTVKRPYLFRPDYRPSGAHGYKRILYLKTSITIS